MVHRNFASQNFGTSPSVKVHTNSKHLSLGRKGFVVRKDLLKDIETHEIKKELTVAPKKNHTYEEVVTVTPFPIFLEGPRYLYLPRHYGLARFGQAANTDFGSENVVRIDVPFVGELFPHQEASYQAIQKAFCETGGGVLCLPPGYGKTALAIKAMCELGLRGLVVVNKDFLIDQWKLRFDQFTGGKASVGRIQGNIVDVEDRDFVIAMLHSLSMKEYPEEVMRTFGTRIFD